MRHLLVQVGKPLCCSSGVTTLIFALNILEEMGRVSVSPCTSKTSLTDTTFLTLSHESSHGPSPLSVFAGYYRNIFAKS